LAIGFDIEVELNPKPGDQLYVKPFEGETPNCAPFMLLEQVIEKSFPALAGGLTLFTVTVIAAVLAH
jgi:hypothetical protein